MASAWPISSQTHLIRPTPPPADTLTALIITWISGNINSYEQVTRRDTNGIPEHIPSHPVISLSDPVNAGKLST